MIKPRVLILQAPGSNRDIELAYAFELAGAESHIFSLNYLRHQKESWKNYQLLALPGGFSYADILGAGKLFALTLSTYFTDELQGFLEENRPIIGICNGFQTLVKLGLLPGIAKGEQESTLSFNQKGVFECRWVRLLPSSQQCIWTKDLKEPLYCPVAHGEGQLFLRMPELQLTLKQNDQIALRYATEAGQPAKGAYPENPNGSIDDIAGLCNIQGNILGLMPHPEDHVIFYQHPQWTRGEKNGLCLNLLKNGVQYAQ